MPPVLLPPEVTEQWRHPGPGHFETMNLRIAGGAEGDQGGDAVQPWPPMVNNKVHAGAAGAAPMAVTVEHGGAMAPKASRRMGLTAIARTANASNHGGFATAAEQTGLERAAVGHGLLYLITGIIGSYNNMRMSHS